MHICSILDANFILLSFGDITHVFDLPHAFEQQIIIRFFNFILIPIGTGKTVTGVHIAYWFAQKYKNSMVFYCGPSNKSVDVVARKYYV